MSEEDMVYRFTKISVSDKKLSKEDIENIEYFQKNLWKSLKIPVNLQGLKEDDVVGVKSIGITKQKKR